MVESDEDAGRPRVSEQISAPPAPDHRKRLAAATWLSLAAAPAFALMAALTAWGGASLNGLICTATHGSQSAMMLMYLLMSAAHLPAWLRRLSR